MNSLPSEQLQLEIFRSVVGFVTTVFTGVMAYLMAKMNGRMQSAAQQADHVKKTLVETTNNNNTTFAAISENTAKTVQRFDELKDTLVVLKDLHQEMLSNRQVVLGNREELIKNRGLIEDMHGKLEVLNRSIAQCPMVAHRRSMQEAGGD